MADLIRIGAGGITAYQTALTTTGNNITNANVEGYTRQEATFASRPSEFQGNGYIGNGVFNDGIRRLADQFLVNQIRSDTSTFNRLDVFQTNVEQLDSLLADSATGLTSGLDSFFSALQAGADDPSSIPARQLILSQTDSLVERFNTLYSRLDAQNTIVNQQITSVAGDINSLATALARVNKALLESQANGPSSQPNDLLDQRDELLRQLAEQVSVTVVSPGNNTVNVFIGSGQPLVVGIEAKSLVVREGEMDPSRLEVGFRGGNAFQDISDHIEGGKLGGFLDFRDEVMDTAFNELGRVALVMADTMNRQNSLGIDLEGNLGGNVFNDINSQELMAGRVLPSSENAIPEDRVVTVAITDPSLLQASDYELKFIGPSDYNYELRRMADDTVVARGSLTGVFPVSITVDGLEVNLESGSFQRGDAFLIQPVRTGAQTIERVIDRTQELAFGMPISTGNNVGNTGNGTISQGTMLAVMNTADTALLPTFANSGELSPPVLIRFTSATTYDVLDNSDPAHPVDMDPPMRGRRFTPNLDNAVFATNAYQTSVYTTTTTVGTAAAGLSNGYPAETVSIITTDPATGVPTTQSLTLGANESARVSALRLSNLSGVSAFADTSVTLQVTDTGGAALGLTLNGVDLTDPVLGTVPSPVTADFLRDRINDDPILQQQGISATSDGTRLRVRSATGEDLAFALSAGGAGSQITLSQVNGQAALGATTIAVGGSSTVGGIVMVDMANSGILTSSIPAPGGRFSNPAPTPVNTFTGYQITLGGTPVAGDEFTVDYNTDGSADNRNALALTGLQGSNIIDRNGLTYQEAYGQLVEFVGTTTSQVRSNAESSETLLRQSQATRDSLSGVNLDEEAAKLIMFEQAYNASAKVISIAQQTFDALLNAF